MKATTQSLIELTIATAEGTFRARYSERGLAALSFPSGENKRPHPRPKANAGAEAGPARPAVRGWHAVTEQALQQALAGRAPRRLPPLDLSAGTTFQQQVWAALREIALGQTRSYRQVAQAIGRPRAVRAVGGACGANPVPVLIPCHRVLASGGGLGGFGGGLDWKRSLLQREGVRLASAR